VFGHKPSYGVVSQRGYLDHVGGGTTDADINVFGPIARSVDDLDLLLGVIAGPDADDAIAWKLELPEPRQSGPSDYRVGVWFEEPTMPMDREQLDILRAAADRLADAGAKVEDAHPPVDFQAQVALFFQLISAAISPGVDESVAEETAGPHLAWLAAQKERARFAAIWRDWFSEYDALLCPILPVPAFPHDQDGDFFSRQVVVNGEQHPHLVLVGWAGIIGLMELPVAMAPVGRTAGGLPVGMQVVAPYLRDREAIRLAGILADLTGCGYAPPPGY
jgi:amidase